MNDDKSDYDEVEAIMNADADYEPNLMIVSINALARWMHRDTGRPLDECEQFIMAHTTVVHDELSVVDIDVLTWQVIEEEGH